MLKNLSLIPILLLTACASSVGSSIGANGVKISLEKDVTHCTFLGDVHGVSSFYGIFAAPALASTRTAALTQAKNLGASHLVWTDTNTNYGSTSVGGNAYSCDKK